MIIVLTYFCDGSGVPEVNFFVDNKDQAGDVALHVAENNGKEIFIYLVHHRSIT